MNKSHAFAAVSTVYFEMKYSVQSSTDSSQTGEKMAKNDFQYGGWNYYTLQYGRTGGSGMTCHGIR